MKDLAPILRSLSFIESEIKVYLTALEKGAGTVLDFAKITKLSRQAVYVAIESLTGRGLMSSTLRGKKRFYTAEHPDRLLNYAERRETDMKERVQDLKRILPELELQMGGERPVVRVFEGKEGIRAIIADMQANPSKNPVELADIVALKTILTPDDLAGVRGALREANAHIRGIYAVGHIGETFSSDPVAGEHVFLPKDMGGFKSNIGIYGNRIVMVTFEGKMHSVIIESDALVKALRILFDLAFKGSRDFLKNDIKNPGE